MIAALSTPPPMAPAAPAPPEIRDIAPPMDVFPYPMWMVVVAALLALLILGAVAYFIVRKLRNRPPPLPPSPQSIALRELRALQQRVKQSAPYEFSIAVSDVLRRYVSAEYRVHAVEQTSPEFLAAIAQSVKFSESERRQLADFLERCDLIKFARIDADSGDSEQLIDSAFRFVEGGRG
jgi:Domain of unknown function (DUF4381)